MKMRHHILTAAALALAASATLAEVTPLRSWAAGCAGCHGTQGQALDGMDSLAGQKKEDLLKKMLDFKTGKKPATVMHQLSKGYSDEQLDQLAGYFASLKK